MSYSTDDFANREGIQRFAYELARSNPGLFRALVAALQFKDNEELGKVIGSPPTEYLFTCQGRAQAVREILDSVVNHESHLAKAEQRRRESNNRPKI